MNARKPKTQIVTQVPELAAFDRSPLPRMGFTVEELAEILSCGRTTIYETMEKWKVKVFYVGRKPLVSPWELERVIREQEKTAA
jgi:hypothetical protein